jgi:hypothetical protein
MQINGVTLPETYYEAGPIDKTTGQSGGVSNSWLDSLDAPDSTTHAYNDTSSTMIWETGFSADECAKNFAIAANVTRYPQNKITYGFPSPNSNSFTHSLLNLSGVSVPWWVNTILGNPFGGPIPGLGIAPGWGTTITW